jgi:hypothetical protein
VIVSEKDYITYRNEIAANRNEGSLIRKAIKEILDIGSNFESLFKFELEKRFRKMSSLSDL